MGDPVCSVCGHGLSSHQVSIIGGYGCIVDFCECDEFVPSEEASRD